MKRRRAKFKARRLYIGKGLSRVRAWQFAITTSPSPDFRGMKYNPRTGWATLI